MERSRRRRYAASPKAAVLNDAYHRAVRAIMACWEAAVTAHIKAKSKRPPKADRIQAALAAMRTAVIERLIEDLRYIGEQLYCKPYREWSVAERMNAARVIEAAYTNGTEEIARRPGRQPKRSEARGLINRVIKADPEERQGLKNEWCALKARLPNLIQAVRLGAWAAKEAETYIREAKSTSTDVRAAAHARLGTLEAARRYIRDAAVDLAEIERAMSVAEAIRRVVPKVTSNPKLAKRLEMTVSRLKRQ